MAGSRLLSGVVSLGVDGHITPTYWNWNMISSSFVEKMGGETHSCFQMNIHYILNEKRPLINVGIMVLLPPPPLRRWTCSSGVERVTSCCL
jgi:hypothetical protein